MMELTDQLKDENSLDPTTISEVFILNLYFNLKNQTQ